MRASDAPTGMDRDDPRGDASRGGRTLSRDQRLTLSHHFRETFEAGRRWPGKFLVLWRRDGEGACLRLGVVVSRRSLARSVDRSRAKRLLRESFRLNRFRFTGGFDVILVARREIVTVGCAEVQRDLLEQAGRAGMLKEPAT